MDRLAQLESDPNNCSFSSDNDSSLYHSANEETLDDTDSPALDVLPEQETLNIGTSVSNSDGYPRAVEGVDSASSSSSVVVPYGAISKSTSLKISRISSKHVPWKAIRHNTSIRKHTLSKPSAMHISSKPTINKNVSINFNLLMPAESIRLPKIGDILPKKPSTKNSTIVGPSNKLINFPIMNICELCNLSFDLRASLMVHKQKHNDNQITCKYCRSKFQKPIAYSTHLKENCLKIPSANRRKLLIQEYNK